MRTVYRAAALVLGLLSTAATAGTTASAEPTPVQFIALGDVPYGMDWRTRPAWQALIDLVNAQRLPVALHVGDFKDGLTPCTDALYAQRLADFQRFAAALVYTPGDNEWIDCARQGADPLERLAALRLRFFAPGRSLGQRPIAVEQQPTLMPSDSAYVENQRWWQGPVLFATFHTVGPDNGVTDPNPAVRAEAEARDAANAAWIADAFRLAQARQARALVLATQTDGLYYSLLNTRPQLRSGFLASLRDTLLPLAAAAPFPVLLVHGDGHRYHFDHPYLDRQGHSITNLWRLEVYGDDQMHVLKVTVHGRAKPQQPFEVDTLWNPLSPAPQGR